MKSSKVIKRLSKEFGKKFLIESENKFFFDYEAYYSPDLILRDRTTKKIKAVIEVEEGTKKQAIGTVITADYCMAKKKENPVMILLALDKQDKKDYLRRLNLLKTYAKSFTAIKIGDEKEVIQMLKRI